MMNIFNDNVIEFYCIEELYGVLPEPKPASKCIPEWYKKVKGFCGHSPSGMPNPTIKKCLPVLDAMSEGYIIPLQGDVHFVSNHDCSLIKVCPPDTITFDVIERHPLQQVDSPAWPVSKHDPLKFLNHWMIKTKPGWSCLFTAPMNHLDLPYTAMSGVVDTDKYHRPINFPALWNAKNYDGTLPAGTPVVQVIPFKRSARQKVKTRIMTKKEAKQSQKIALAQRSRSGVYTQELREKR